MRCRIYGWLFVVLLLQSCSYLTPPKYDATIDDNITTVQLQIETMINHIDDHLGTTEASYSHSMSTYETIDAELDMIITRARGFSDDPILTQQLTLLRQSVNNFEQRHKSGFKHHVELQHWRHLLEQQFESVIKYELAKPKVH